MKFEAMPRIVRQAGINALGWRNRFRRYGEEYRSFRAFLVESEHYDQSRIEAWQLSRLKRLIEEARQGTPHYRSHAATLEKALAAARLDDALGEIAVLEKKALKADTHLFFNANRRTFSATATSGSTGAPLRVQHDIDSIQRRFAVLHDHLQRHSIDPFAPSIRLSGRLLGPHEEERPWLWNSAERQLFASSYALDQRRGAALASVVRKVDPVVIDGYPSAILQLLRLASSDGVVLRSLKAVVSTAETLLPEWRQEMETLGNCKVLDYYAASEGVALIQQCAYGTYHVRWQSGIFEVADGSSFFRAGSGELVCTSFVQDKTPLIRYRTGDFVEGLQHDRACQCGMTGPTAAKLLGRVEDLVHTPDGRSLGMFSYRTLKYIEGLGETQVVQAEFARFEVVTTGTSNRPDESIRADVAASFERVLGYPVQVDLRRVPKIPKGPNGKLRLVISEVSPKS